MAERRLRSSIKDVADFWYTAWINAGQPDLHNLKTLENDDDEKSDSTFLQKNFSLKSHLD
jgi:hypothetical protein